MMTGEQLAAFLRENSDKPFVKRILSKDDYKPLDLGVDERGNRRFATHRMAWGESDGKYYVFPTVAPGPSGDLMQYDDNVAWIRSQLDGDAIEFKDAATAEWFSKNYKQFWNQPEQKTMVANPKSIKDIKGKPAPKKKARQKRPTTGGVRN